MSWWNRTRRRPSSPPISWCWNVCIALVVTAAGAVAISLALAYYVSAPIRTLNQAAHALAQGEFDSPSIHPGNRRRDEIGMLRVAFEDMAEQLRARHNTLEARVGSTQAELQQTDIRLQHTIKAAVRSNTWPRWGDWPPGWPMRSALRWPR